MKIGVCGLGMMGRAHLANLMRIEGATVVALCDADQRKLDLSKDVRGNIRFDTFATSARDIPQFTDFDQMLDRGGIDAVVIALPTHLHAPCSIRALHAGKHVFCEKPIALNAADAERMCSAARDANRVLFIGHVLRFFPAYQEMLRMIKSGDHGRVLTAEFSRLTGLPGWGGDSWFTDPARSGGMPLDLHIHDADFILYAFGEPEQIQCFRTRSAKTGVDVLRTTYVCGDAIVASYGGWLHHNVSFRAWASITFEHASVFWRSERSSVVELCPSDSARQEVAPPAIDGYEAELREFLRCAEAGRPSAIAPPESALASLRLVERELACAVPR